MRIENCRTRRLLGRRFAAPHGFDVSPVDIMIDKDKAIEIAREWVLEQSNECDVFSETVKVVENNYLINWNTKKYIKSRKFEDMVVGPGYIIINCNTGELYHLGSGYSESDAKQSILNSGRPGTSPTHKVRLMGGVQGSKSAIIILRRHLVRASIGECRDIVHMAQNGSNPIIELNDEWEAKEVAEKLNEDGLHAKQIWE